MFVLLAVAVVAMLIGLELISAAAGENRSPWDAVSVPDDTGARVALLVGAPLAFGAALVAVSRPRGAALELTAPGGGVVVPQKVLVELVEGAFAIHPDVVRVRAAVAARDGRLSIEARILLRPGAVVTKLDPFLGDRGAAAVKRMTGLDPDLRRLRYRVLRVSQLARYL